MAKKIVVSGGQEWVDIYPITAEAVAVISGTAGITLENIKTLNVDENWITGAAGSIMEIISNQDDTELTEFLKVNIAEATDEIPKGFFQKGTKYSVSGGSSPTLYVIAYAMANGGLVKTFQGPVKITSGGSSSGTYNTESERPIQLTSVEWEGTGALTIDVGRYESSILKVVTPSVTLPLSHAVGTAGIETFYEDA